MSLFVDKIRGLIFIVQVDLFVWPFAADVAFGQKEETKKKKQVTRRADSQLLGLDPRIRGAGVSWNR